MAKTDVTTTRPKDAVEIYNYSEKSIAVIGNTFPLKNDLKALGGTFNSALNINGKKTAGWIFSKSKENAVREYLESEGEPAAEKPTRNNADAPKNTKERKEPQEKVEDLPFLQWLTVYYLYADIITDNIKKAKFYFSYIIPKAKREHWQGHNQTYVDYENLYALPKLALDGKDVLVFYPLLDDRIRSNADGTVDDVAYFYPRVFRVKPSGSYDDENNYFDEALNLTTLNAPKKLPIPKNFVAPIFVNKAKELGKEEYENWKRLAEDRQNEGSIRLAEQMSGIQFSKKLRADLVRREILMGKMEVALDSYYDGMTESTQSTKGLDWYVPDPKKENGRFVFGYIENCRYDIENDRIRFGSYYTDSYYARYLPKMPQYIVFPEIPENTPESNRKAVEKWNKEYDLKREKEEKEATAFRIKRANRYLKAAETLRKNASKAIEEAGKALSNTPKRQRETSNKRLKAEKDLDLALIYEKVGEAMKNEAETGKSWGANFEVRAGFEDFDNNVGWLFVRGIEYPSYYSAVRDNKLTYVNYIKQNPYYLEKFHSNLDRENAPQKVLEGLIELGAIEGESPEKAKKDKLNRLKEGIKFSNIEGFFPTPKALAEQLVESVLNLPDNPAILEPSAGKGDLAEVIKEKYPNAHIDVIERMYSLREILELEGYNVVGDDFLEYNAKKYDIIFMNPPFENGQDIDHVTHAFSLLKEGGELAAIVSATAYSPDNQRQKWRNFAELVDKYGEASEVITDAFKGTDSFRQTGVAVRIITLKKPKTSKNDFTRIAQARATRFFKLKNA